MQISKYAQRTRSSKPRPSLHSGRATQPDLRFERTASIFKTILRGNLGKCHQRTAALGVDWMEMLSLELQC